KGSYTNVEKVMGEWTWVGSAMMTPTCDSACSGATTPVPILFCLELLPGTYAFYLIGDKGTFESNGQTPSGMVVKTDAFLTLYSGRGQLGGTPFSPNTLDKDRAFEVIIHYRH